MKKLLCVFLALMLLTSAALAEGHLITGTLTGEEGESELTIRWGTDGFTLERENCVLAGRWQADGGLLLALSEEMSVLLPALPKVDGFSEKLTALLQDSVWYYDSDMKRGTAIVIGTESTGLTGIWREAADEHIRIPMLGRLDSLNASVSAAILLFEAVRQRQA